MLDLRIANESMDFINVYETEQGNKVVYGRELYEGLCVSKSTRFIHWINDSLENVDAIENEDYFAFWYKTSDVFKTPCEFNGNIKSMNAKGCSMEYILKLEIAKEICLIAGASNNASEELKAKSKAYRKYLIQVEERYKEMVTIPSYAIADPIERAKAWIKEEEERQLLETKNKELQAVNSILSPKANIFDRFINTDTTFTSTDLAKVFDIASARKLNTMLKDNHIAYKQGKSWYAYSTTDATWYKQVVNQYGTQLRWTAQGLVEIAKILGISLNEDTLEQYVS